MAGHHGLLIPALLISALTACGEGESTSEKKNTTTGKTGGAETTENPDDGGTTDSTDPTPEEIAANSKISGRQMWELKVHPMLEETCKGCHADPRFPKEKDGPLTIYSYDKMLPKLKDGSSVNNALLRKMNGISHEGGNRCISGLDADPCASVVEWYKAEFGDDGAKPEVIENPDAVSPDSGGFTRVTPLGRVFGWAVDKANLAAKVTVKIYIDGDKDSGELAITKEAGEAGPDGNHTGDHQFSFDLPAKFRDKSVRSMYLYAVTADGETQLAGPEAFVAYNYSDAGKAFFEANVEPKLTQCKSCHVVSYTNQFASLLVPPPDKGGTKAKNELINKAGTRNGTGHGGGNRCGSGSPCSEFEQWWEIEFKN